MILKMTVGLKDLPSLPRGKGWHFASPIEYILSIQLKNLLIHEYHFDLGAHADHIMANNLRITLVLSLQVPP